MSDFKISLPIGLGSLSSKVLTLWNLDEGNWSYIPANLDRVSEALRFKSSASPSEIKTANAWMENKDLPLNNSTNIPSIDFKISQAIGLGSLSSKVLTLWDLDEGNWSYIPANLGRLANFSRMLCWQRWSNCAESNQQRELVNLESLPIYKNLKI